jgi:membrane-associated phospholipid phosphatase
VLTWNNQTNRAIQVTSTDAFNASRALALESIAVLDTVRSLDGGPAFLVRLNGPPGADPAVAAAAAANTMLRHLFPARRAALDAALELSLAQYPPGPARDRAVAFGATTAEAVLAIREHDGSNATAAVKDGTTPGQWRPTPPALLPPLVPQWAKQKPFVLTYPGQFRPAGPPGLGTPAFRDAAAFVASIGSAQSAARTPTQTEIAHYWSDAIGTYAPAGHWNAITASILAPMGLGLDAEAEIFARLNVAMTDAGIAVADAKYTYWFWRPITVIRAGGAGATPVPEWRPLLDTPNHPSYISGHSGFSGAAAVILTARFGTRPFSFSSSSVPGVTRSFTSFQQAAEEAAFSRVLGGIHFAFDNADGLTTGRAVGAWTLAAFQRIAMDRGPVIVMDNAKNGSPSISGYALDNKAPVLSVTARLDGHTPFTVAVDGKGRFAIPRRRLATGDSRDMVIAASSITGRHAIARLRIDGAGDTGTVTAPLAVK